MDQRDIFGYEARMMPAELQNQRAAFVAKQVAIEAVRIPLEGP
jgi:hypothetical protein